MARRTKPCEFCETESPAFEQDSFGNISVNIEVYPDNYFIGFSVRRVADSVQCPWAWEFKPVPGWVADPAVVHKGECYKNSLQSYIVKQCPLFEKG